uniref:Putative ribonuclease H-like domain-containing protein n=2 Tax=Tanacetum cinerariifolium TaxID=118510 RepID=A0A6L2KXY4_TANCI|nr:putative ribonuclease H-like domain-containing protein [Tanacetum cinerariifolium]
MEAIEKRFGGNTETKKVQKTLLKQQFENFTGSSSEGLDQIHDRLQKIVSQLEIHGVYLSQKDVNLNLKIYETEVKQPSSTSTASQNLAFVSSSHTDSTTDSVSAIASVFAACVKLPASPLPNVDSLSNAIDVDDLEEMDLRWQMAMLTMRARRFLQKTGRNLGTNGPTSMGFDMFKVECYNCHRKGHFARECRSTKDPRRPGSYDWSYQAEEEPTNFALMAFSSSSSDNEVPSCSKTGLESVEARLLVYKQNKFQPSGGYHAVPPSYTGTFMPPKPDLVFNTAHTVVETDYLAFSVQLSLTKPVQDLSHTNRPIAHLSLRTGSLILRLNLLLLPPTSPKSNSSGQRRNRKACFVCKSVNHLIKYCNFHTKKMAQPTQTNYAHRGHSKKYAPLTHSKPQKHRVPTTVLTQSKPASNTTVRPVSAALSNITVTRPRHAHHVFTKFKSSIRRHITRSPSSKTSNSPPRVTAIQALVVSAAQGKQGTWGNPQQALKDKGVIDSGCSRHITRNMSYLTEFDELNRGYVAFGGNPKGGKITSKGKIKTGKLDFDDVYFVKELKFNLFSVSQMEFSVPKTPQQNDIAERKNRTLIEAARTMLAYSLLPIAFWAEAVNTTCYVQNRVLVTKAHNKNPYKLLHGRTPSIGFMRPFGCHMTILNTLDPLVKFQGKVDKGFLVGYYNNDEDVAFDGKEHDFDTKKPESEVILFPSSSAQSRKQDDKTKKEAKGNSHVESVIGCRDLNTEFEDCFDNISNEINAASSIVPTIGPTYGKYSFIDASQLPDDPDMPELEDITYSDDEDVVGAEADFNNLESSIPVSHIPTIRIHKDHPVSQIIGFEDPDHPDKVYKVVKALYGLHQAPRAWYKTLATYLLENGFQRGTIDQTLFIKKRKGDILLVKQKKDGIFISQDKYVPEILRKFRLTEGKSASNPIDIEKHSLKNPDGKDVDVHTYRSMIGSLMYLTSSRPDIMFACKKQTVVATSSTEAEYVAAASCCAQVLWIQNQLLDNGSLKGCHIYLKCWLSHHTTNGSQFTMSNLHKNWLVQKQTALGKDSSNPLIADNLPNIVWYSTYHITLMKSWLVQKQTALGKDSSNPLMVDNLPKITNDVTRLQDLVDRKKVVITEAAIRDVLRLDDAEGVDCLANEEIFAELARMGYEKPSTKLTFYKAFFSSQWKFLIHTILQSMSAKRTSWNEFSSAMTSAVICLSTSRKFNFSKYIFESLVRNVDITSKFYMYPRFIQLLIRNQLGDLSTHTTKYTSSALTQKVFANMRKVGKGFSGVATPLFEGILVAGVIEEEGDDAQKPSIPSPTPPTPPPQPSQDLPSTSQERMIDDLDKDDDDDVSLMDDKVEEKKEEEVKYDQVQGRQAKIYKIDMDHASKVLSTQEDEPAEVQELVDVVTTAKLITEVVTAASTIISAAEPQVPTTATTTAAPQQVEINEEYARKLHEELNKDIDWDVAIEHVKQKAKEDTAVQRYQLEEEESKAIQSINETPAQKAAKTKKLNKEVEDLKRHFEIVPDEDDDVYTKATPLARKVHIMDYEIIHLNNKPHYKIIRADGTHQLYVSFLTLLKNFDREDLESLWSLVKERFSTSKPNNFSDDFLLTTLGAMFEKPDAQAQV